MAKDRITNTPLYYLKKYKITQRPKPCDRCRQNAYYYHPDYDYLCAAHLLDLVNIGGLEFSWDDYPEVWNRMGRLINRAEKGSTTANNVEPALDEGTVKDV